MPFLRHFHGRSACTAPPILPLFSRYFSAMLTRQKPLPSAPDSVSQLVTVVCHSSSQYRLIVLCGIRGASPHLPHEALIHEEPEVTL